DKENGFLCRPTNKKAFTNNILYLLNNPKTAQQMGRKGKEHIKNNFLITRLFEDYIDLFTEYLIKNKNKNKKAK
ncbi:MAG: glycosyltransferase, partial [Nanoarchaeota archaeon]